MGRNIKYKTEEERIAANNENIKKANLKYQQTDAYKAYKIEYMKMYNEKRRQKKALEKKQENEKHDCRRIALKIIDEDGFSSDSD